MIFHRCAKIKVGKSLIKWWKQKKKKKKKPKFEFLKKSPKDPQLPTHLTD